MSTFAADLAAIELVAGPRRCPMSGRCDECGNTGPYPLTHTEWQSWWQEDGYTVGIHTDGVLCPGCFDQLEQRQESSDPYDGTHIDYFCEVSEQ